MMKKIHFIYLVLIVFISCSSSEELPVGILNQEEMVNLLVDVEIAQAKMKFEVASEGKKPNYIEEYNAVQGTFVVDAALMGKAKETMIVMHPLPRVGEIHENVDSDKRAVYFQQMQNGMFTRMALLALALLH